MRIKWLLILSFGVSLILLMGGLRESKAEISLTDWLSVTGFFRYEVAAHTGWKNPNNYLQTDNNDLNFQRQYFQAEFTAKPSDCFKLVAKLRLMADETQCIDGALGSYKSFPLDVPKYNWTMLRMGDTNEFRAEFNELYSELNFGHLWVRMGKQQIVWGEMIATRILDIINPLDFSRNLLFEPEEFDNIRIPEWAIRWRYEFGNVGCLLREGMLEGFVNPIDWNPTQYADFGSPFYLGTDLKKTAFPQPFYRITDRDRRGDTEFGFRLGGMMGNLYFTLNYMRLYNDDYLLKFKGFAPDPIHGISVFAPFDWTLYDILFDQRYPLTNVFGLTANYFIRPLNTVVTFETTWTPDQPYQDARVFINSGGNDSAIRDQGTWNYAIRFDRSTFVFPHPISAMLIQLQFNQTVREGDPHNIFGAANSKVNKTDQAIVCQLGQDFHNNDIHVALLNVYQFSEGKDGEYFKPQVTYYYGDHWFFDLYTVYLAGSDKRPGFFGGMDWVNETVARITYQF